MPAVAGELFGLRRIGSIVGAISMSYGVGGSAGLYGASYLLTATDSYNWAYAVDVGALLISAGIVLVLKPPAARPAGGALLRRAGAGWPRFGVGATWRTAGLGIAERRRRGFIPTLCCLLFCATPWEWCPGAQRRHHRHESGRHHGQPA